MTKYVVLLSMVSVTAVSIAGVGLPSSQSSFTSLAENQLNTFSSLSASPSPTASATPTPSPSPTPVSSPTPVPGIANHIVISEVQIAGATTTEDFVEIYNPTVTQVDISGWKLRKSTSTGVTSTLTTFNSGEMIPAHGYYLWANNQTEFEISIGADDATSGTLAANNSVALLSNTDLVIDKVAWGNGTSQQVETTAIGINPTANQSIERKAYSTSTASTMSSADSSKGNGFDQNDNSTDFVLRTMAEPQNSSSPSEVP